MIKSYQKFQLPDQEKQHNLIADVNWSEDPKISESKVIRFTLPNGEKTYVKREDLNQILFALGNEEDQSRMIPQTVQPVHWRRTVLGVKATKDVRKGEMMNFPIEISFPCTNVKEVFGKSWEKDVKHEQSKDKHAKHGSIIT